MFSLSILGWSAVTRDGIPLYHDAGLYIEHMAARFGPIAKFMN